MLPSGYALWEKQDNIIFIVKILTGYSRIIHFFDRFNRPLCNVVMQKGTWDVLYIIRLTQEDTIDKIVKERIGNLYGTQWGCYREYRTIIFHCLDALRIAESLISLMG